MRRMPAVKTLARRWNMRHMLPVLLAAGVCAAWSLLPAPPLGSTTAAVAAEKDTAAAGWPQFLGPNRNGVSPETGLIDSWGDDGPAELWRTPVTGGMSGVSVANGLVCTMAQSDGQQLVVALNAADGKVRWQTEVAPAYENSMGDGPRATPVITADTIFAFTGDGTLVALAAEDGKLQWKQSVFAGSGGSPRDLIADYGMACSPLVVGKAVVVTAGAPNGTVMAFDRKTGKPAWTAGQGDPAGYSSPVLVEAGGKQQLVAFTGSSALGIAPADGTVLWRYPWVTDYECNVASPVSIDGQVLLSSGEQHGSVLLQFKATGSGKLAPQPVWDSQGRDSTLRAEWQTPVLLDGYLYGFDNVGSAGPVTHLTCVEAATGKRMWQKARFGKGNLIAADGKLFATTMKGELVMVEATPEEYRELGRKKVIATTRQAPALAGGKLYLRDGRQVVCFDVRN